MAVDRGRAGIEPQTWRFCCTSDSLTDEAGGYGARAKNFPAVRGAVAAIDAPSREIDDDIRTLEDIRPIPQIVSVPDDDRPLTWLRMARDNAYRWPCSWKCRARSWPISPVPPTITTRRGRNDAIWDNLEVIVPRRTQRTCCRAFL